jgi:exopolysaccharide production protein ExoQ
MRDSVAVKVFRLIFEPIFAMVLLLANMGVIDSLIRPQLTAPESVISTDVPRTTEIAVTGVYVCGAVFVLARWRRVFKAALRAWPLLAFAALAPVSAAWSIDPALTLRRSVLVIASTVLAIYMGARYSLPQLARLLGRTMCLMILLVIALRFVAPGLVIDAEGAWRGLSPHKNTFGAYMGIALVVLLLVRFQRFKLLRYIFVVAAAVLLFLSHSMAALAGTVLVLAAVPLWRSVRLNTERRVLACALAVMVLALGVCAIKKNPDLLFQFISRDPTFTGRTKLWSLVLPSVQKRPLLGYGYGAFWWTGLSGEAVNIWIPSRWFPTAADNGYVDLLLDAGVLAVPFLLYVSSRAFRLAFQFIRCERRPIAFWPVTYFCFFFLNNVFESQLLTTRSLGFLLFTAIITCLAIRGSELPLRTRRWSSSAVAQLSLVPSASHPNA